MELEDAVLPGSEIIWLLVRRQFNREKNYHPAFLQTSAFLKVSYWDHFFPVVKYFNKNHEYSTKKSISFESVLFMYKMNCNKEIKHMMN